MAESMARSYSEPGQGLVLDVIAASANEAIGQSFDRACSNFRVPDKGSRGLLITCMFDDYSDRS